MALYTAFEQNLGYTFRDKALLRDALTHSSYANEHRAEGSVCNERLEFLGDAILGFVVAEYLYRKYPQRPEGELTRIRAELVCEKSLARVAGKLHLGDVLRLGRGEETGGGSHRPSMLADAVEAVLAAAFLDSGMEAPRDIIRRLILAEEQEIAVDQDYKTQFQELVQRERDQVIVYRLVDEAGPDHSKTFTVEVCLNGAVAGRGVGRSKKRAEQAAAQEAIQKLFPNG